METPGRNHCGFHCLLLPAGGVAAAGATDGKRPVGVAAPGQMVRSGACDSVPGTGFLYCRRGGGVRQPGLRHEIPRPQGQQVFGLWRGVGVGQHPCRLFLHHPAAVCRHLSHGRRAGTGQCLSLFGTGNQYSGHCPDRCGAGAGHGGRPRGGGREFRHRDRRLHALLFSQGGAGKE